MGYRDDWLGTSEELSTTLPGGLVIRGSYNEPGYLEQAVDAISPMQNIRDTKTAYDEGRYWDAAGNAALVGATVLPIGKGLSIGGQIAKPFIQKGVKALAPQIGKGVKAIGGGSNKLWKGIKRLGEPDPSVVRRVPTSKPYVKRKPRTLTERQERMRSLEYERKGITGAFGRSFKREQKQDYRDSLKDFETWDAANKLRNMGIRPGGWTK